VKITNVTITQHQDGAVEIFKHRKLYQTLKGGDVSGYLVFPRDHQVVQ
jgi:hypothetical protein